jgi:hypothetical protein
MVRIVNDWLLDAKFFFMTSVEHSGGRFLSTTPAHVSFEFACLQSNAKNT